MIHFDKQKKINKQNKQIVHILQPFVKIKHTKLTPLKLRKVMEASMERFVQINVAK